MREEKREGIVKWVLCCCSENEGGREERRREQTRKWVVNNKIQGDIS